MERPKETNTSQISQDTKQKNHFLELLMHHIVDQSSQTYLPQGLFVDFHELLTESGGRIAELAQSPFASRQNPYLDGPFHHLFLTNSYYYAFGRGTFGDKLLTPNQSDLLESNIHPVEKHPFWIKNIRAKNCEFGCHEYAAPQELCDACRMDVLTTHPLHKNILLNPFFEPPQRFSKRLFEVSHTCNGQPYHVQVMFQGTTVRHTDLDPFPVESNTLKKNYTFRFKITFFHMSGDTCTIRRWLHASLIHTFLLELENRRRKGVGIELNQFGITDDEDISNTQKNLSHATTCLFNKVNKTDDLSPVKCPTYENDSFRSPISLAFQAQKALFTSKNAHSHAKNIILSQPFAITGIIKACMWDFSCRTHDALLYCPREFISFTYPFSLTLLYTPTTNRDITLHDQNQNTGLDLWPTYTIRRRESASDPSRYNDPPSMENTSSNDRLNRLSNYSSLESIYDIYDDDPYREMMGIRQISE